MRDKLGDLLRDIFCFLEVDDNFLFEFKEVYNVFNRILKIFLVRVVNKFSKYSFIKFLYLLLEWVKK